MKIVAVIPARLASSRLPRKVLLPLAGRPMLTWVVEAAQACSQLDRIIVATDSEEVMALGRAEGWEMQLTSPDLTSGSDRVHAVSLSVDADIFVNVQGDEPMLRPGHIDALLRAFPRTWRGGRGDDARDSVQPGRHYKSECREGGVREGGPSSLFLTSDDPFRSRSMRDDSLSEASWPVCLPQGGTAAVCFAAAGHAGTGGTAGTAAAARERNVRLCRGNGA